jgi:hypothetical protein
LGDMLKAERFVLERVKSLGGNKKKESKNNWLLKSAKLRLYIHAAPSVARFDYRIIRHSMGRPKLSRPK